MAVNSRSFQFWERQRIKPGRSDDFDIGFMGAADPVRVCAEQGFPAGMLPRSFRTLGPLRIPRSPTCLARPA